MEGTAELTPAPTSSAAPVATAPVAVSATRFSGHNILGINLAALPQSGPAYERVKKYAAQSAAIDWNDRGGPGNTVLLAKALMGDKAGVLAMVQASKGGEVGAHSLPVSRSLAAVAIALNLVDAHEEDAWLREARDRTYTGFGSLLQAARKANNHGSAADQSLVAVDLHLGDRAHLEAHVIPVVKQRFGDTSQNIPLNFGDLSFQADPTRPVVIGLPGASRLGISLDGILAEEQRRQGTMPALNDGNYNFGASGQLLLTAYLLEVGGYGAKSWVSSAVLRVFQRFAAEGWQPAGDDAWQGHMVRALYGVTIIPLAVGDGKTIGLTDYLFAGR